MSTNLLESMTNQLTPQMIQKVSSRLGETPAQTQKAVDGAVPTLLAALMHFSSLPNGPTQLLDLINHDNYGRLLNNLSGLCDEGNTTHKVTTAGQEILRIVFADKLDAVSERIAAASGVTNASASLLLSLTAPVVVGVLGRVRAVQGLNATRLVTVLMGQKEVIAKLTPAGLAGVFGSSTLTPLEPKLTDAKAARTPDPVRRMAVDVVKDTSTLKKWRWPILGVVTIGLLSFLVSRDTGGILSLMVNWNAPIPAVVTVTLPGDAVLSLEEDSFNYHVAKFLADPAKMTVPKTFVFDHVYFAPGTARFTPESGRAVEELSTILKAYPAVDVRLDGHTDDVGSTKENEKLSRDRASAVQETLIRSGISATRVTTAGYGQEYPLASNETEAGRAKNQRLELVVLKK